MDITWFKKITLYVVSTNVRIRISEDIGTILKNFITISKFYSKISAELISNEFGLPLSMTKRILELLTWKLKILQSEEENNEILYSIKDGFDEEVLKKRIEFFVSEPVIFSFSPYPLFYVTVISLNRMILKKLSWIMTK